MINLPSKYNTRVVQLYTHDKIVILMSIGWSRFLTKLWKMKNKRIVLVDIYSSPQGFTSRIDITGDNYSYLNLNGSQDLRPFINDITHFIANDIDINQGNCRVRFCFSKKSDHDVFIEMQESQKHPIKLETISINNFMTLDDLFTIKPAVHFCFLKSAPMLVDSLQ